MKLDYEISISAKRLFRERMGSILIIFQLALTLTLLSNVLHIFELRWQKIMRPYGVSEDVFYIRVAHLVKGKIITDIVERDIQKIRNTPGVKYATSSYSVPLSNNGFATDFKPNLASFDSRVNAEFFGVDEFWFRTMRAKIVAGRDFIKGDVARSSRDAGISRGINVVVTQDFFDAMFPAETPIEQTFYGMNNYPFNIVGVVDHFINTPESDVSGKVVFIPTIESVVHRYYFVLPEKNARDNLANELYDLLLLEASEQLIYEAPVTMKEQWSQVYKKDLDLIYILVIILVTLVTLSMLAIAGLTSFWVESRREVFAIQRALGARRMTILRQLLLETLLLNTLSIIPGVLASLWINQKLVSLYDIEQITAFPIVTACLMLVLVTQGSALVPAWRVAQIPVESANKNV